MNRVVVSRLSLGLLAAWAVAGCGNIGHHAVSTPSPSRSTRPSLSPTPTLTPLLLPCQAAAMATAMGSSNSAAGHIVYAVVLTNDGTQTCTLQGYPTVTLMAGTDPLPTTQTDGNDGLSSVSNTPSLLTIAVGQSVSFVLQFSDVPTGTEACTSASYLQVQLPGGSVGS